MFGYVIADLARLDTAQQARYKSVYCGLCRALYRGYGPVPALALTYDMAFLTLLLSALYEPDEKAGAARCLREGGSLTIFAAMNIETGSRVDDSIVEDLKGTANMELVLDTAAARAGIYPPVNLLLSGTKRAELIASKEQLDGIQLIHEMLGSLRAVDMIPQLLSMLEKTTNNEDLLVRIKDWAALMKQ